MNQQTKLRFTRNNPSVIGIGYKAQSGKDTIADFLVENTGYVKLSMSDPLKELVLDLSEDTKTLVSAVGWERAKRYGDWVRPELQHIGTTMKKHFGEDFWAEQMRDRIAAQHELGYDVVIPDVRFLSEVAMIRSFSSHFLIEAYRPDRPEIEGADHISETELDGFNAWDFTLRNTGSLLDLEAGTMEALATARRPQLVTNDVEIARQNVYGISLTSRFTGDVVCADCDEEGKCWIHLEHTDKCKNCGCPGNCVKRNLTQPDGPGVCPSCGCDA